MRCELCGTETYELVKAMVEGTNLVVCSSCGSFGKVIEKVEMRPIEKKQVFRMPIMKKEIVEVINPDFARIVRNAREKSGLDQEKFAAKINERVSILHKLETGSFTPDIKLAKKLEKLLGISLVETSEESVEVESLDSFKSNSPNGALTFGDMVRVRKK